MVWVKITILLMLSKYCGLDKNYFVIMITIINLAMVREQ